MVTPVAFYPMKTFLVRRPSNFKRPTANSYRNLSGSISLTGVDDAPFLAASEIATDEDTSIEFGAAVNEFDGDEVIVTMVVGPTSGLITQLGPNLFRYDPEENFFGRQNLQFKIQDTGTANAYESDSSLLVLRTNSVNDAPTATVHRQRSRYSRRMLRSMVIPMTDVDNDVSELSFLNGPSDRGGSCGFISANPVVLRYDPAPNYFGTDSCPFYPTDGQDLGLVRQSQLT